MGYHRLAIRDYWLIRTRKCEACHKGFAVDMTIISERYRISRRWYRRYYHRACFNELSGSRSG